MKENEIREAANCAVCGKPFGHAGVPLFWRVKIERLGVDMNAVRRQDGLAGMLGSPALASVMGPDADMTETLLSVAITLCERCVYEPVVISALAMDD